ncbi:MAG: site-2 protease family protein [bacterium]
MIDILRGAIAIIFTFSFAIFVHELGHFIFAKLFGVHVQTFCIGFGRKIWRRTRGGTEYAIAVVPFGGYVKLTGMHSKELEQMIGEDTAGRDEPDKTPHKETLSESVVEEMNALRNKSYPQKLLIFSAGCINNFLTAVVIYFLLLWIGHDRAEPYKPIIDRVNPSVAGLYELRKDDVITTVGARGIGSFDMFETAFYEAATKDGATSIPVAFRREGMDRATTLPARLDTAVLGPGEHIVEINGKRVRDMKALARAAADIADSTETVDVKIAMSGGRARAGRVPALAAAGPFWPALVYEPFAMPYVALALPNLPADRAGIRTGDVITAVNGNPVSSAADARDIIRSLKNADVPFQLLRGDGRGNGAQTTITLMIGVREDPEHPGRGQIGVAWGMPPTRHVRKGFFEAWAAAAERGAASVKGYIMALGELFSSNFQTVRESVGGPIAIGTQTYKAAQQGIVYFFELFALFNIILAVTNLLPLPILDGGHILFASIEAIIRRPLPAKFMIGLYNVFLFLIIGLAILITFNDVIMNLWRVAP